MPAVALVSKEAVLNAIREMPEAELTIEAILDRLVYLYHIEEGLAQSRRGEVNSLEDVRQMKKSWARQESI